MRLRAPEGGVITVERPYLPFTPTEFARARALVELDARLGPRIPLHQDMLTLPEGNAITVRRADVSDVAAAKAMHERCSPRTLSMRYHGPVGDADRYLNHLLSPRFGRTLAVQTASGRVVGLGHLLWDGDETEIALLVEDDWQRRGIGAELLGRLVTMAVEAGCESVYAVTQASNTGMVAAMRGLDLPSTTRSRRAPSSSRPAWTPLRWPPDCRTTRSRSRGRRSRTDTGRPRAPCPGPLLVTAPTHRPDRPTGPPRPPAPPTGAAAGHRPRLAAVVGGHDAVADGRRMLDQAVDTAEAHRRGDQTDPGDDLVRVAVDLEGDHGTADPRIVDAVDARIGGEPAGEFGGVGGRGPDPYGQGRQAAQQQIPGQRMQHAPVANRTWRSPRANSSSQATTPAMTSPCPPRYLVALCRTKRAPCSAGRCSTGVAKVLSASSGTDPQACATARRSSSASVGLAGDSTMTRPVSGRRASAMPAGSTQVTSEPSSPAVSRWSLQPYRAVRRRRGAGRARCARAVRRSARPCRSRRRPRSRFLRGGRGRSRNGRRSGCRGARRRAGPPARRRRPRTRRCERLRRDCRTRVGRGQVDRRGVQPQPGEVLRPACTASVARARGARARVP